MATAGEQYPETPPTFKGDFLLRKYCFGGQVGGQAATSNQNTLTLARVITILPWFYIVNVSYEITKLI